MAMKHEVGDYTMAALDGITATATPSKCTKQLKSDKCYVCHACSAFLLLYYFIIIIFSPFFLSMSLLFAVQFDSCSSRQKPNANYCL